MPEDLPACKTNRTIPDGKPLDIINVKRQDFKETQIERKLDILPNTVRSLVHRMQKNQTLYCTRGRPKKKVAPPVLMETITLSVGSNPLQSLVESTNTSGLNTALVMRIRHSKEIRYHDTVPIALLKPEHIRKRNEFAVRMTREIQTNNRPIICTEESTFVQALNHGEIWRHRGVSESIGSYTQEGPPISVLVSGAIGTHGFHTRLIRRPPSVNGESYQGMIFGSGIIQRLDRMIGFTQYCSQQDNALDHRPSREPSEFPARMNLIGWPVKCPDLLPIEHLEAYFKTKTSGIVLANRDALFAFLVDESSKIPSEIIERFWSSFPARFQVCAVHGVHASMGIGKRSIGCIIQANMKKNLKPPSNQRRKEEDRVEGGESD
jgi:hypothetical protein